MSTTLTWSAYKHPTKLGTGVDNLFSDIVAAVNANSANAAFKWQIASSQTASNPYYVVLKRKDGSAGRLLIIMWTTAPGSSNLNPAYLETNPTTGWMQAAYFPNGNVDTPSNLMSSSGTVMGDDTDSLKCVGGGAISNLYGGTNQRVFYFESEETFYLCTGEPSGNHYLLGGGGKIIVDDQDDAHDAVVATANISLTTIGANNSTFLEINTSATPPLAGAAAESGIRANIGADKGVMLFKAFRPGGTWANRTIAANDILSDTVAGKYWFVAIPLVQGYVKGGGMRAKFRQFGWGPQVTSELQTRAFSDSSPAAIGLSLGSTTGAPWVTNFKI